ncbi:hypothetical protein [Bacillus sp. AFS096315]|uniref:hypothetical protein n=1 Tax=Bacillus sp. AFS096315 TaxID=2033517 RepID=UPI000BEC9A83|nr:hypothetical protein [Bacillus sp. AFS096315]PEC48935.1 hypothetical protein CON00_15300 [Bacillus sp. AFS096315]
MFIKIYNSFITVNSENKLTINELFIYCYLYTLRTYENKVLTNYDILCIENEFYKNKTDNKKEIKKCIISLSEKKLINIDEKNKSLMITFWFEEKGHVQITYDKFRTFTKPRDLYIYIAVSKWENLGGARYSNNDWADLLDLTREYAITVIEDACERGIIYKQVGTYTGNLIGNRNQKIQEKNTYSIKPFSKDKFKVDEEKEVDSALEVTSDTEINDDAKSIKENKLSQNKDDFGFNTGKWFNWGEYLDVDDCEIYIQYREQSENDEKYKRFIEYCEKRINKILYSKGKKHFEEMLKKAQDNIKERKRQQKLLDARVDKHIAELNGELEEFKSSYKKKEKIEVVSIMDFLDDV